MDPVGATVVVVGSLPDAGAFVAAVDCVAAEVTPSGFGVVLTTVLAPLVGAAVGTTYVHVSFSPTMID